MDSQQKAVWGMWHCAVPGRGWLPWHSLRKNKRVSVHMLRRLNCHPWQFTLTVQYFIATSSGIHKTTGPSLLIPVLWSFMAMQRMGKIWLFRQRRVLLRLFVLVQTLCLNFRAAEKQRNQPFPQNPAAFQISKPWAIFKENPKGSQRSQWNPSLQNVIINLGKPF